MTITNSIVAKLSVAVVAVAMAFALVAPAAQAQDVSSMSLEELVALVNQLQSQLSGSDSVAGSCSFTFTRSLGTGSTGADVMNLQKFLNMSADTQVAAAGSAGGPGSETSYYGPATAAAVSKFQVKYSADILVPVGLTTPTGYFGPSSMAKANAVCAGMTDGDGDSDGDDNGGDLEGGAGSIESFDEISSFSNEEVGEDEEDVEIAGIEIEADDGSDLEFTAVRLDFATQPGNDDLNDYITEVSIWMDGEEYARVDADEFNDDNEWTKTVSLDDGAIIRAGETGDLVVAVSAAGNVDSDDAGDDWGLDFVSVRFVDADGATITEDTTTDEFTWDVNTFSAANDVEMRVSLTDGEDADAINEEHVINVESGDNDTDDVEVLAFTIEAEGSDITVDDIPAVITTTGEADEAVIVRAAKLLMDGDELDSVDVPTGGAITFTDLEIEIEEGDSVDLVIAVDLEDLTGGLDEGDTVKAEVTTANVDAIDAEDSSGENIADDDAEGSAVGEAHPVYDDGIQVSFVDSSYVKTSSDTSGVNETVEFTLEFDVTAIGDEDIWVDKTCGFDDDGTYAATQISVSLDGDDDGSSTTCTDFDSTGDEGTDGFEVLAGATERFTVTILGNGGEAAAAGSSSTFTARINAIGYNVTTDAAGDTVYSVNLDDFESDAVTVFDR